MENIYTAFGDVTTVETKLFCCSAIYSPNDEISNSIQPAQIIVTIFLNSENERV